MKKKNKHTVNRKEWLAKLGASVESSLFLYLKFSPLLLLCFIFANLPTFVTTPVICFESPAVLSSCCIPTLVCHSKPTAISMSRYLQALVSRLRYLAVLLSCYMLTFAALEALFLPSHVSIFCCGISCLLLSLLVLSTPLLLGSFSFKIFKKILLNKS